MCILYIIHVYYSCYISRPNWMAKLLQPIIRAVLLAVALIAPTTQHLSSPHIGGGCSLLLANSFPAFASSPTATLQLLTSVTLSLLRAITLLMEVTGLSSAVYSYDTIGFGGVCSVSEAAAVGLVDARSVRESCNTENFMNEVVSRKTKPTRKVAIAVVDVKASAVLFRYITCNVALAWQRGGPNWSGEIISSLPVMVSTMLPRHHP